MRNAWFLPGMSLVAAIALSGCNAELETVLSGHPTEFSNEAVATFTFSADADDAIFQCQLDDGAEYECASPTQIAVGEGTHTFKVRAVAQGAEDPTPATYTWMVDTTKPDTTITQQPTPVVTKATEAVFKFTSTEQNSTFKCKLDDGAEVDCESGKNYSGVENGQHTFTVYATDRAGNKDEAPAMVTWTVDVTGPVVTIVSGPTTGGVSQSSATFTYTSSSAGISFECALDGTAFTSCNSGQQTINNLVNGTQHTFRVRAVDVYDNEGPEATRTWTVDTQPPTAVTVTAPGATPYVSADSSITIRGACEDTATVTLLDSTAGTSATALCAASVYSFGVTKNSNGVYSFTLTQTDRATNTSGPTIWVWTRDTNLPATPTITTPAAAIVFTNGSSLTISGGCEAGLKVTLGGAASAVTDCSDDSTYSFNVNASSDNTYAYSVKQTSLSALDSGTAAISWVRDTGIPPAPTRTSPATSPFVSQDTSLIIIGDCETDATVTLFEDGATITSTVCMASSYSVGVTKNNYGAYTFTLRQTDRAANQSGPTTFQWTREAAAPVLDSSNPDTGDINASTRITITGENFVAGITATVGGLACTNLVLSSATQLACDAPSVLTARTSSIVVTNLDGKTATGITFAYTGAATYTTVKTKIFLESCMPCHAPGAPSAGLDLTNYSNVFARTTPGDALASTLYKRVTTQGPIMPRNAPALSAEEKQAIADWINAGALNN